MEQTIVECRTWLVLRRVHFLIKDRNWMTLLSIAEMNARK
jgi:hypothetical protein